jgi:hypothetical protein
MVQTNPLIARIHKVGPSEKVPPDGASLGYGVLITKFCLDIVYEVKMLSFAAR